MVKDVIVVVAVAADHQVIVEKLVTILKLDLLAAVVDLKEVQEVEEMLVVNQVEVCRAVEGVMDRLDLEDQMLLAVAAVAAATLAVEVVAAVMTLEIAPEIPLVVVEDLDLLLAVLLMG
jgi:hypothetical protein